MRARMLGLGIVLAGVVLAVGSGISLYCRGGQHHLDRAFLTAAAQRNERLTASLLSRGANPNAHSPSGGTTALHMAVRARSIGMVRLLCSRGANQNERDSQGETPLMAAARDDHPTIIRYLLERGAPVNAVDASGRTALMHAAALDRGMAVDLLLRARANPNLRDAEGNTALLLASGPTQARQQAYAQLRPLWGRPTVPPLGVLRSLLDAGADVRARNEKGETALMVVSERDGGAPWQVIRFLVDAGAELHAVDREGRTALIRALEAGAGFTAHSMVEAGADLSDRSRSGETALQLAVKRGQKMAREHARERKRLLARADAVTRRRLETRFRAARGGNIFQAIVKLGERRGRAAARPETTGRVRRGIQPATEETRPSS